MKDIWIYGAGGFGKEVATLIYTINRQMPEWNLMGFVDDNHKKKNWFDLPVISSDKLQNIKATNMVVAIGNPQTRSKVVKSLAALQLQYPALVSPEAHLQHPDSIEIGVGSIITAGTILTCDVVLGEHCIVNLNCTIGHDVSIGNFGSLMCGINVAGNVRLGNGVFVGSGANILNNLEIGDNCKIGAGAVVNHSFEKNKRVMGVPARSI